MLAFYYICMYVPPRACRDRKPAAPCLLSIFVVPVLHHALYLVDAAGPGENLCKHSTVPLSPMQANSTMHVST
jgi:hypothetical protein